MAAMTVEEVYVDYQNRRLGLIKALTTEVEQFLHRFNNVRRAHFLYGLPNATWEIRAQARPNLPRPRDIDFSDESTEERKDWLMIVASHCDEWLRSYCAYSSGHFNNNDRGQLLDWINDLPTVQEVVNDNFDDNEVRLKTIEGLYNDAEEVAAHVSDDEEAPVNEEVAAHVSDDEEAPVNEEVAAHVSDDEEAPINEELEIQEPLFVEEEIDEDLCYDCRMERDWMAGNKCMLMTSAMKDNSKCPSCRFKKRRMH